MMANSNLVPNIRIDDKEFKLFIEEAQITASIQKLAEVVNVDYHDKNPVLIVVLNGAVVFACDLLKQLSMNCEMEFVKISSYHGTASTGNVQIKLDLDIDIENRHVMVIEDIVDTGNTLSHFIPLLKARKPLSVKIASLLLKPDALKNRFHVDYAAMEIPNEFIVGYGLDYNGKGRNLRNIYQVCD